MRYLVTGGAGFIGSHLVDELVANGDEALVIDDFSTGRPENLAAALETGHVKLVEGSVTDTALVEGSMASVDACFHLASAVGVKLILGQPLDSLLRNVRGCDVVLGAAAECRTRVLFASSSEIYGKDNDEALDEDADRTLGAPQTLRWSYSTAKAFGESLAHAYQRELGTEAVIVRLFNTVGPRQAGAYGMVLPRFVRQALAGESISVYGDGAQSRCFTHVYDTVAALTSLIGSDAAVGNTYNVGSPVEVPIIELARQVAERTGTDSEIEFIPYDEAYAGDDFEELGRRKPNIDAIREAVGWEPSRTLVEMIDDTLVYERTVRPADSPPAAITSR
jgi:UDP-glucose 4-epimerase